MIRRLFARYWLPVYVTFALTIFAAGGLGLMVLVSQHNRASDKALNGGCAENNHAYLVRVNQAIERWRAEKETGTDAMIIAGWCPYDGTWHQ